MQVDDYARFQVQYVGKHTVVEFRRKDFKEARRADFLPHAEISALAKTERGRGDKILCRQPRRGKPVKGKGERLALRVKYPMQHL